MSFGELLDRFRGIRALVIGDLMVDEYIFGKASRISPEAPVMVIRQERVQRLPGGAANVARNLVALGAKTSVAGVAGNDEAGSQLENLLSNAGIHRFEIARDDSRETTKKTRVVADHAHQVIRIDAEDDAPLDAATESALLGKALGALRECDVVVLSDYLKGALTRRVASEILAEAKKLKIPAVVNPKPRSLPQYAGATLVSFNRREASEALGRFEAIEDVEAESVARGIAQTHSFSSVLITLGEGGMVAVGKECIRVEAPKVEVYDTAGAGDTVVATVALGLASCGFAPEAFRLAAQTAACVVRHVGVATPSAEDLAAIRAL